FSGVRPSRFPLRHMSFIQRSASPRSLLSFPTRRSSDLSSSTLSWMIYDEAFQNFDIGRASAAATVLLILLLALTFLQLKFGEKKDRKSTRLNSSHVSISYAVFCLKKKNYYRKSTQHVPP